MHWVYLFLAGCFEIGWPLGLKLSDRPGMQVWGIVIAAASMAASGALLWLALKGIPIGTAYAIWTGIGAAGTFVVGIWFFGDASSLGRYVGVAMIVGGVVMLKLSSNAT